MGIKRTVKFKHLSKWLHTAHVKSYIFGEFSGAEAN